MTNAAPCVKIIKDLKKTQHSIDPSAEAFPAQMLSDLPGGRPAWLSALAVPCPMHLQTASCCPLDTPR